MNYKLNLFTYNFVKLCIGNEFEGNSLMVLFERSLNERKLRLIEINAINRKMSHTLKLHPTKRCWCDYCF